MFIAGFGIIFIILGAIMANLIGDIFAYEFVSYIAGAIIILFGLHIMGVLNIKFLNYEKRADFSVDEKESSSIVGKIAKFFAPFLLGVSFALGWTPCIGPIFASIVSLAAKEGAIGLSLMVVYTIGLAIPFLLAAILTSRALSFFNKIKQHFKIIEIVAGVLLVLIGIAVATGGLGQITTIITNMFS